MTLRDRFGFTLKVVVSHTLYNLGLLQLWQAYAMRGKAVVLMYHRVLTPGERDASSSHPALVVERETFARQMAFLKRRFRVLSVEEFAAFLERRKPFPNSSCLITFDDGWRDNYENALPALRAHGLPALMFLPVNYIGHPRVFWQEALTHLLVRAIGAARRDGAARQRLVELLTPTGLTAVLDITAADPKPSVFAAVDSQKRWPRALIEDLLRRLAEELGIRLEDLAATDGFMSWEQVQSMGTHRVAFGAHGVEHLLLSKVSPEEAEHEIRESWTVVDARLKPAVKTFSYPNGYTTPDVVGRVKAAGYRLAFVTRWGFVSPASDPLTLPRRNVHEGGTASGPMFLARLMGFW